MDSVPPLAFLVTLAAVVAGIAVESPSWALFAMALGLGALVRGM
jgi:hypothetical protein